MALWPQCCLHDRAVGVCLGHGFAGDSVTCPLGFLGVISLFLAAVCTDATPAGEGGGLYSPYAVLVAWPSQLRVSCELSANIVELLHVGFRASAR